MASGPGGAAYRCRDEQVYRPGICGWGLSSKYPEIAYHCATVSAMVVGDGVFDVELNGDLTLHGFTRAKPMSARVWITGDTLRASGGGWLKQAEYGLARATMAGTMLKVKDALKLAFEIITRQQSN